jgi:endonuclease-3
MANPFEAFRFGAPPTAAAPPPAAPSPRKRPRAHTPVADAPPSKAASPPPPHWHEVLRRIRAARAGRTASVDAFHAFLLSLRTEPAPAFQALVASLLSVQCRDVVALAATRTLRAALGGAITPEAVAAAPPGVVEDAVATCNMRNAKARFVRAAAAAVLHRFGGRVPEDIAALETLPGVGPKISRLLASVAFGRTDGGIVVDTHVHRVAGRLGWAGADATPVDAAPGDALAALAARARARQRTPERTRRALEVRARACAPCTCARTHAQHGAAADSSHTHTRVGVVAPACVTELAAAAAVGRGAVRADRLWPGDLHAAAPALRRLPGARAVPISGVRRRRRRCCCCCGG